MREREVVDGLCWRDSACGAYHGRELIGQGTGTGTRIEREMEMSLERLNWYAHININGHTTPSRTHPPSSINTGTGAWH